MACEPVGEKEIAERLGVRPRTVSMWKFRGLMPEASWTVSGKPAWQWAVVERWAKATGRIGR